MEKVKNGWGNIRRNEGIKRPEESLHGRITTHLKGPGAWNMKSVRNKEQQRQTPVYRLWRPAWFVVSLKGLIVTCGDNQAEQEVFKIKYWN